MGKLNDLAVNAYKYSQKIPVVDKIVNAAVRHPSTAARIGMYGLAALTGATIVAAADTSLVGAEGFTPSTPTPPPPPPPPPENHNKGGIGNGSAGLEDVILQSTNAGPVAAGIAAVAGIATGAIHIRNKHKARYQLGNSEVGISYRKESNVFDQYMKAENGAGLKNITMGMKQEHVTNYGNFLEEFSTVMNTLIGNIGYNDAMDYFTLGDGEGLEVKEKYAGIIESSDDIKAALKEANKFKFRKNTQNLRDAIVKGDRDGFAYISEEFCAPESPMTLDGVKNMAEKRYFVSFSTPNLNNVVEAYKGPEFATYIESNFNRTNVQKYMRSSEK